MTASPTLGAAALLDGLPEASFLIGDGGTILLANRAAAVLLGPRIAGRSVHALHEGDPERLARFINRCWGSRHPMVGTINLPIVSGRCQCRGNVVGEGEARAVLLRLTRSDEAQFTFITRNLGALRDEVRARQQTELILRETISERELLLRELQHRVSNNMQMLAGILNGAEREADSEEAKEILSEIATRFGAIGVVQQLLYRSSQHDRIDAKAFVETLGRAAVSMAAERVELATDVDVLQLPIAMAPSLALILNELLTNAVKYGKPRSGLQNIRVSLKTNHGALELCVADNGPGFHAAALAGQGRKRASGLGLVKGLLRPLRGSLTIDSTAGACCIVRISQARDDLEEAAVR